MRPASSVVNRRWLVSERCISLTVAPVAGSGRWAPSWVRVTVAVLLAQTMWMEALRGVSAVLGRRAIVRVLEPDLPRSGVRASHSEAASAEAVHAAETLKATVAEGASAATSMAVLPTMVMVAAGVFGLLHAVAHRVTRPHRARNSYLKSIEGLDMIQRVVSEAMRRSPRKRGAAAEGRWKSRGVCLRWGGKVILRQI